MSSANGNSRAQKTRRCRRTRFPTSPPSALLRGCPSSHHTSGDPKQTNRMARKRIWGLRMRGQVFRTHNQIPSLCFAHLDCSSQEIRRSDMNDSVKYLRTALVLVGLTFVVGIYALVIVWPSGWAWHKEHSLAVPHYLQMILGVYATLGVFLVIASRDPLAHLSLIWFTVWSSVVHAGIMAAQALANSDQRGHLWGDVPALLVVAAVLAVLTPRRTEATALTADKK